MDLGYSLWGNGVSSLTHVISKGEIYHAQLEIDERQSLSHVPWRFHYPCGYGHLFAATNAVAACGDPSGLKPGVVPKVPFLMQPGGGAEPAHPTEAPANNTFIVGLWYVNYTSGGQPLYQSFDQWHSDGTELENPNLAPATGPLCVGVWKQVGTRTFRLHHIGWNFDMNGNSLGSFTLDETNTVSPNGLTYKGTFDLKFYDVDRKLVDEVTGTQKATRITVN